VCSQKKCIKLLKDYHYPQLSWHPQICDFLAGYIFFCYQGLCDFILVILFKVYQTLNVDTSFNRNLNFGSSYCESLI